MARNPAETAYRKGRSTITAEEAVGLPKRKKRKEPSYLELLWYGPKWYEKRVKNKGKTGRTVAIEKQLGSAGLGKRDIARLRRRKR